LLRDTVKILTFRERAKKVVQLHEVLVGILDSKKIPVVNFDRDPFSYAKEISLVLSIP
jgi:hypothetical protein